MPKYAYRCQSCEHQFEVRHSIRDRLYDCVECEVLESLVRIPQIVYKQTIEKDKPGGLVKEYIEENKQILEKEKRRASSETYKS